VTATLVSFPADGAVHNWIVPSGVTSIQALVDGGMSNWNTPGARCSTSIPVLPGDVLTVMTGRASGAVQPYGQGGGGNGGASAIWSGSATSDANLLVVAGGAGQGGRGGANGERGQSGSWGTWGTDVYASSTYIPDSSIGQKTPELQYQPGTWLYGGYPGSGGSGGDGGIGGTKTLRSGSGGGGSSAGGNGYDGGVGQPSRPESASVYQNLEQFDNSHPYPNPYYGIGITWIDRPPAALRYGNSGTAGSAGYAGGGGSYVNTAAPRGPMVSASTVTGGATAGGAISFTFTAGPTWSVWNGTTEIVGASISVWTGTTEVFTGVTTEVTV